MGLDIGGCRWIGPRVTSCTHFCHHCLHLPLTGRDWQQRATQLQVIEPKREVFTFQLSSSGRKKGLRQMVCLPISPLPR